MPEGEGKIICLLLFIIFCLTWYAHRSNIERLLCGKESKVSLIKSTKKKIKASQKSSFYSEKNSKEKSSNAKSKDL